MKCKVSESGFTGLKDEQDGDGWNGSSWKSDNPEHPGSESGSMNGQHVGIRIYGIKG